MVLSSGLIVEEKGKKEYLTVTGERYFYLDQTPHLQT
jgi:hypothetical protein